jgi:hypothetical protein
MKPPGFWVISTVVQPHWTAPTVSLSTIPLWNAARLMGNPLGC